MTDTKACHSCGEVKAEDCYELLYTGGRRGTCIACRRAASAAGKRRRKAEERSSPAYLARQEQLRLEIEARAAAKEADKVARAALRERKEREAAERKEREVAEREERAAALQDEIWSAMWRGRSHRALTAVHPKQQGLHRIRLRYERGYISIAELACRCAERDACHRASRACQTPEAVGAAARILEQPTETLERTRQVNGLWRSEQPPRTPAILRDTEGADENTEGDPFADAFGDWAPSWVQHAHAP